MNIPTHPARALSATVALVLALGLTACGDNGSDAGPAGAPADAGASVGADPCTLVDQGDLEEAVGATLTARGDAVDEALGRACHWDFPDRPGIPGSLSLTVWHGAQFFSSAVGEPLDGLGDEARSDASLGVVLVRTGDEVVQVQVLSPDHRDAAPEIARLAAAAV